MLLELMFCALIPCAMPPSGGAVQPPPTAQPAEQSEVPDEQAQDEPQSPPAPSLVPETAPASPDTPQPPAADPPTDTDDQLEQQTSPCPDVAAAQAQAKEARAAAKKAENQAKAAANAAKAANEKLKSAKDASENANKVAQEKADTAKEARERANAAEAKAAELLAKSKALATKEHAPVSRERSYTTKTTTETFSVEKSFDGTRSTEKSYTEKTITEKTSVDKSTGPAESEPTKTGSKPGDAPDDADDQSDSEPGNGGNAPTASSYRPVPHSFDELRPPEQLPMNRGPFGTAAGETAASQSERPAFTEVWTTPAHFPRPAYRPGGEPLSGRDGLLIFEGMSLEMYADGRYTIKFVGEAPATPVELRLQFMLFGPDRRSAGTITLPQILIPSQGKDGQGLVRTWKFTQSGYSHAIKDAYHTFKNQSWERHRLYVHRDGTARYGTRPW